MKQQKVRSTNPKALNGNAIFKIRQWRQVPLLTLKPRSFARHADTNFNYVTPEIWTLSRFAPSGGTVQYWWIGDTYSGVIVIMGTLILIYTFLVIHRSKCYWRPLSVRPIGIYLYCFDDYIMHVDIFAIPAFQDVVTFKLILLLLPWHFVSFTIVNFLRSLCS